MRKESASGCWDVLPWLNIETKTWGVWAVKKSMYLHVFGQCNRVRNNSVVCFPRRGLIYTENKPLGRLCKMCNPFFHEFPVIPPEHGFQSPKAQ
jgi:hypothetical protein